MIKLPEKIRRNLEKIVKEMRIKEDVYGVGLFASWSRGDATKSSDVDLLVLDKGNFNHEFVERIEINGLLIDLDHIPKAWIHGQIPSELDQKLYEMQILYDRDWSLTNTKLLMAKSYGSPERVDIRAEGHVVESDIYLSRATSAFSRKDFQSAQLFAAIALEKVLNSMAAASQKAGVSIVAGDTKVVPKGKGDKIYINTTGVGLIQDGVNISGAMQRSGIRLTSFPLPKGFVPGTASIPWETSPRAPSCWPPIAKMPKRYWRRTSTPELRLPQ